MINPRQVRILVVDDEREIRELLAARFSIFGFQSLSAANGNEAWQEICADSSIKIVVTDLLMPDGTGQELLAKCKQAHPEFPKVFAISGQPRTPIEELFAQGAEGLIHKPFDARSLLNTVRNAILSLEERLRYPPYIAPSANVELRFESLYAAFKSGEFALGRGGFFVATSANLSPEGSLVTIDINCGDFAMTGTGAVRWRRRLDKVKFGAGVELLHLNSESIKLYKAWVQNNAPVAFIPSPQTPNSMPSMAKLKSTG